MGDVERVMERVHRLLAIANDPAASDNEQRIALEQAQRLMNKHAIEEWQLEEDHDDVEIIERRIRLETNPCNRYMAQLANIVAHNAEFDVSFLDAAEHVYDPTASGFDCRWLCTKEMSWELNPQKRHHRVTDLIADYHIGDTEEHRALADAIQEQMIYQALCREATTRGKWIER